MDANTIECETEDDECERLDNIERSEYIRELAERNEE